jgi:3',5'-cyclic AMP phosphodiesterase CpdA
VPDRPVAAAAPSVRLIHFSDLHLWGYGFDRDPFPKRIGGLANLAFNRSRAFPRAVAEALLARLAGEEADFILFSGDVSTTALKKEFRAARELFAPLRERWGERFIAIPGNHDRYTPRATRNRLYERLFLEAEQRYPIVRKLGKAWDLVGFDAAVPRWIYSHGDAGPALIADLARTLKAIALPGRRLLATGHFPILYPAGTTALKGHAFEPDQREALRRALAEAGVEVYLHGHKHRRWGLRQGATLHLNAGSAGMLGDAHNKRPGYLKIELPAQGAPRAQETWLESESGGKLAWASGELAIEDVPA